MDQIIKHGVQMAASLDPASQKELRATLETIFSDAGKKLDFNTPQNRANIENLAKAFQSIFAKAGNTSIDFTKLMKMPSDQMFKELGTIAATQFWDAWNAVSGRGGMGGVVNGVKQQIDALTKQRSKLMADYEKASKAYDRYDNAMGLRYMESDEFTPLHKQKDINKQAYDVMDNYDNSLEQLSKLERGAKGYNVALLQAFESYEKLFKMKATLDLHDGPISDDVLSMYGDKQLKGLTAPFLQKYGKDMENVGSKGLDYYQSQMDKISGALTDIDSKISAIQQKSNEAAGQSGADKTLLELKQIEAAYDRILNKSGSINKAKGNNIQAALDYDPKGSDIRTLDALSRGYNKSLSSNENWEQQYQWLTKFVREYEAYASKPNADQKKLEQYKGLYQQLQPMAENARNMLQNVLNMANNVPLVGMGDTAAGNGASAAQNEAEAEAKARIEAEAKAKADKESANAEVKARAEAEAKAKADVESAAAAERERLAQEAAAKVAQKSRALMEMSSVGGMSKERFAYLNTENGDISDYIEGGHEGVRSSDRQELLQSIGGTWDSTLHTHPETIAAPSEEDIQSFVNHYATFRRNFILAGQQLAEIDFTGLAQQQAQQLADAYRQNVIDTEDARVDKLTNTPLKELGVGPLDINSTLTSVSEQLSTQFPQLASDINSYIENLRSLFQKNPVTNFSQDQLEEILGTSVDSKFGDSNKHVQADIFQTTKDVFDSATGIPAMYQKELQGVFTQTIGDLGLDPSQIFKLHNVDDFQAQLDKTRQQINQATKAQEQLNQTKSQEPKPVDDTAQIQSENGAIDEQNSKLKENSSLKTNAQTGTTAGAGAVQGGVVTDGGADVSAEASQLTNLQNVIAAVTTAVGAKTQAFTAEEAEVKRVVASEIGSLGELEQKLLTIKGTLEGLLSNLKTGQSDIGAGLSNVTVNVNKTDGADAEQKGSWALDTTVQSVRTSVDGVRTDLGNVITAIGNVNTQQTTTGADATLATEATLGAVKAVLDAINGKIVAGTKGGSGKQSEGSTNGSSEKKTSTSKKKLDGTDTNKKDEANQAKHIETLQKEIGARQGELDNTTNERVRQALQEEIALRERIIQLIHEGSAMSEQEEARQITDLSEKTKAAKVAAKEEERVQKKTLADQQKAEKKAYDDFVKETRKEAGMAQAQSTINKAGGTLKDAALIDNASPEATAKFKQLDAALKQLNATYAEINSKPGPVDPEDQQRLIAQRENVQQLQGAVAQLVEEHQRLNGVNAQQIGTTSLGLGASSESQQKAITDAVMAATKGRAAIKGFNADTNELTYTLKTGANQFTTFKAAIDRTNGSIMAVRGNTTQAAGVFATLGRKIKEYSYYFTGSMMIYRAIAWVREGITAIKEIDTALTELKKVTDATEESYENFLDTAAKTADKVGSTIKEVVSSTADWARLNI